jgi:AcrR family transcriptional regulator
MAHSGNPDEQNVDIGERRRGRARDPRLDTAILAAAEQHLRERSYQGMSLESVAAAAGTSVPSVRRRYRDKAELAAAVVDSLRVEPLTRPEGAPREVTLAILENFARNLRRPDSMALLGTLLAEERRTPQLLERFRARLASPRRRILRAAVEDGIQAGELAPGTDPDVVVNMLIGSFYARYVSTAHIPRDWPRRTLAQIWPEPDE